jgi:catechol 2,3-dioxygenase-like lactoylglutathione lyase family enzyme
MLTKSEAFSSLAVPDIKAARRFYELTLGLEVAELIEGTLQVRLAGGGRLFLYPKPDFVPATYTVLNFPVEDIERTVDALKERGVKFDVYDRPIKTDARGISLGGKPRIAWFRDPAGNILSVIEMD